MCIRDSDKSITLRIILVVAVDLEHFIEVVGYAPKCCVNQPMTMVMAWVAAWLSCSPFPFLYTVRTRSTRCKCRAAREPCALAKGQHPRGPKPSSDHEQASDMADN